MPFNVSGPKDAVPMRWRAFIGTPLCRSDYLHLSSWTIFCTEQHQSAYVYLDGHYPIAKRWAMPQAQNSMSARISKALHAQYDEKAREPLPQRWVELIRHLNELDQMRAEATQWE